MQNLLIAISLGLSAFIGQALPPADVEPQQEQVQTPAYAKWGKIAMKETKAKYPNADIIDYLHEGSRKNGDSEVEMFKLWLKQDNKEFGVYVNIEYKPETEEVTSITFKETDR
ncbi:YqzG/YhdC family protein [Oceanobacillus manasiensis]|uniref:YqzG/YhdC family protein n=1 Tax=Oceanobacillus manasiensis TaxID=586413 RepID=UPI0005AA931B|nr:YqzG/YhdC family protein [Oceanobacillus manasiensis]